MPLVYNFSFAPPAAGLTTTVKTLGGDTVHTEAMGSAVNNGGAVNLAVELEDEATYVASVDGDFGTWYAVGVLDLAESVDRAGSGVGADQTAYFVATGPADVSDGAGAAGNLTFVADPSHDALPDWATIVSGDIVLTEDAGTVAWSLRGAYDFDFTESTPVTLGGTIQAGLFADFDGTNPTVSNGSVPGDGQTLQTSGTSVGGGVGSYTNISVVGYPSADEGGNIPDAAATPRVALTITRIAQAATLPEA